MTPIQTVLYAATLFLALSSLHKWKFRRESKATRMGRSLRLYQMRLLTELTGEMADGLSGHILRTA